MTWWWLFLRVPGALHLYELGDVDADETAAAVALRCAEHNVPDDWLWRGEEGWDVTLGSDPHPSVLEMATTITRLEDPE